MRNTILLTALLITSAFAPACTCIARGVDQYRTDTRSLVETKNSAIKACYDRELAKDANLNGDVVINFTVEKKTGVITGAAVDSEASSAPPALGDCIVQAVEGLTLDPYDQRDGIATFTWRFKANPVPAA
ncbi:MAG: AgmX/PglI C-terminal domain-containing protein [Myxococcales bacterium]|nr:AgmX/PglI C-terminal domain-containing protein [Myxococcales bacterium]